MTVEFRSDVKGDVVLNVFNMLGQRMTSNSFLAIEGLNQFNLNVSAFTKGAYFVEVVNGDQTLRKEFIVMK
jgi:hypothetical protein